MKITRIIASTLVITTSVLVTAAADADAQTVQNVAPPAETPPSSYTGKQYVDSRGCIYVRGGIDGAVTWVPRVGRDRRQICGYKPTAVAGATAAPSEPADAPVVAAAPVENPAENIAAAEPENTQTTTALPEPQDDPKPKAKPQTVAAATSQLAPVAAKKPKRAAAPTVTTVAAASSGSGTVEVQQPQSLAQLPLTTRVVPRHVYENRQNVRTVKIPKGYRPVWDDDRLNPYRAERTLAPAVVQRRVKVPRGYAIVDRHDDRFNAQRGVLTAQGDAQTDLVWSNEVPRKLIRVPATTRVIQIPKGSTKSPAEATRKGLFRISTRSGPSPTVQTSLVERR
jgi:hypothetical protein